MGLFRELEIGKWGRGGGGKKSGLDDICDKQTKPDPLQVRHVLVRTKGCFLSM